MIDNFKFFVFNLIISYEVSKSYQDLNRLYIIF